MSSTPTEGSTEKTTEAAPAAEIEGLQGQPLWHRLWGYARLTGPGYLQSALTLGSGTASACLLAGANYGYSLLWLQPLSMVLGIIILSAIAHQTLIAQERPYRVFWTRLHPSLAILWGLSALLASIIWHFPQYSLAGSVIRDWGELAGVAISPWLFAPLLLAFAIFISWSYARGSRGVRLYERLLKYMVWGILLALALVVVKTGVNWGALARGFLVPTLPRDPRGLTVVLGALGATVGINMVFLYPYSLLRRRWSKPHLELAYFDLWTGMFLPFTIATSLLIVATANTLYGTDTEVKGALEVAQILTPIIGLATARAIMGLGLLAMALSTITLHMLASGFIVCEMLGKPLEGWPYRLAMLVPIVGVLGVIYELPFWLGVLTSSICLLLMPAIYVCFLVLHNSTAYLGADKPTGRRAWLWNAGLGLVIGVITFAAASRIWSLIRP